MQWRTLSIRLWAIGLALLALAACGGQSATSTPAAGGAGTPLPLRNEILSSVTLVGQPELFTTPWDASPGPDGATIYFTADSPEGPGVFKVPFGGGAVERVAIGPPFMAPRGLAISPDGQWIYVADPEATGNDGRQGRIFAVAAEGGPAILVGGTEGAVPRGIAVTREQTSDVLSFSGVDPASKRPAVMRIRVGPAGPLGVLVSGAPLVEPGGLAVAQDGTIYVADRLAAGNNLGSVFRISGATVTAIAGPFRAGTPVVGAALTLDESALLVSALAPDRDSAQVLLITLPGLEQGVVNKVIEANAGAGGLHRAPNRNVFAWAGSGAPIHGRGGVYALNP